MRRFLDLGPLLLVLMWSGTAQAHGSFLVNTTADANDGACESAPAGNCSLREAIMAANALVNDHPDAPDAIAFDFGLQSEAPFLIALESPLPPITEGVVLNGGSEPHYIVSREHVPVILIDGSGFDHVLEVRSDSTLVIALAFTNAAVSAIDAELADFLLVQGCYFGIQPSTGAALYSASGEPAFGHHAIHVRDTFRARIGGQGELTANVIAGAGAEAVLVERGDGLLFHGNYLGVDPSGVEARPNSVEQTSAFSVHVRDSNAIEIWDNVISAGFGGGLRLSDTNGAAVERNLIGLDASGRAALGNGSTGLLIEGDIDQTVVADNWISANAGPGVVCAEGSLGAWHMLRNSIGVDFALSDVLPNAGHGVLIETGCAGASIGSSTPDDGNLIVHNQGAGIRSVDGRATIRANKIFLNQALEIDAGPSGRTENDPSPDELPVNFPEGLELRVEDSSLTVRACVPSGAIIEVFEAMLGSGPDAGAFRFLGRGVEGGSEDRDASAGCSTTNEAAFDLTLPIEEPVAAVVLSATLSDHTSELSAALRPIDEVPPEHQCTRGSDCGAEIPICDPVFRHCVECIDDADGDEADTGCSPETPRCVGSLSSRACREGEGSIARPRELPAKSAPTGCSVAPEGDGWGAWAPMFGLVLARRRKKRVRTRSET